MRLFGMLRFVAGPGQGLVRIQGERRDGEETRRTQPLLHSMAPTIHPYGRIVGEYHSNRVRLSRLGYSAEKPRRVGARSCHGLCRGALHRGPARKLVILV